MIEFAGPSITQHEIDYVIDAMHNWYGKNKYFYCEKFEKEFASYHNRKYGISTPNCTTAIHLVLASLRIGLDDEVIIPDLNWIAGLEPIIWLGATPVFSDVTEEDWCICPESLKTYLSSKTKVIIAVDLYGNLPNFEKIEKICRENNITLIEDAAEAFGSGKYYSKGNYRRAGSFGDVSVFSFHRTKTLCIGEGGIIITDNKDLYDRCMYLRNHARDSKDTYYCREIGYKYMPSNIQSALGLAQLYRAQDLIDIKRRQLHLYKAKLKDIPNLQFNYEDDNTINGVWCTAIVLPNKYDKNIVLDKLNKMGIPARPFFHPLSSLPAYNNYQKNMYEVWNYHSYNLSERGINMPCAMNMIDEEVEFCANGLKDVLENM